MITIAHEKWIARYGHRKDCKGCAQSLPVEMFDAQGKLHECYLRPYCRECQKEVRRQAQRKTRARNRALRDLYKRQRKSGGGFGATAWAARQ